MTTDKHLLLAIQIKKKKIIKFETVFSNTLKINKLDIIIYYKLKIRNGGKALFFICNY
jgi:hypothetical protein